MIMYALLGFHQMFRSVVTLNEVTLVNEVLFRNVDVLLSAIAFKSRVPTLIQMKTCYPKSAAASELYLFNS